MVLPCGDLTAQHHRADSPEFTRILEPSLKRTIKELQQRVSARSSSLALSRDPNFREILRYRCLEKGFPRSHLLWASSPLENVASGCGATCLRNVASEWRFRVRPKRANFPVCGRPALVCAYINYVYAPTRLPYYMLPPYPNPP